MQGELTSGWRIILAGALGLMMCVTHIYSLSVMMVPLQAEFGWNRKDISFGMTIVSILAVPLQPLAGILIDRLGYRKIVLPGVLLYSCAIGLLSLAGPGIASWYMVWGLIGVSFAMLNTVWVVGIVRNFEKRRGLAISLCLMGVGLGAILIPSITATLNTAFGWRTAYLVMGAGGLLLILPLTLIWYRDRPEGLPGEAMEPGLEAARLQSGLSRAQIFRSRRYWQLAAVAFLAMSGLIGISVHFVALLVDTGVTLQMAAAVASLIGIGNIIGRLLGGYLLDRIHGSYVGGIALSWPVVVALLLLYGDSSLVTAGLAAFLIGLTHGTESDVVAYVTSRYFGLRHFGLAFSTIGAFMSVGIGVGPALAGAIFDRTGGYQLFLQILIGAFILAVILITTLGPYPKDSSSDGVPETSGQ